MMFGFGQRSTFKVSKILVRLAMEDVAQRAARAEIARQLQEQCPRGTVEVGGCEIDMDVIWPDAPDFEWVD